MIKRVFLSSKELRDMYDELRKNDILFRIAKRGVANSLMVVSENTKYINKDVCKSVDNPITGNVEFLLSGEYAKLCIKAMYNPFHQYKKVPQLQSAPLWYSGSYIDRDLVYFDIKSCYYQIYKKLSLDFTEPKMMMSNELSLCPLAEKLHFWKSARNAVTGFLASEYICDVRGRKHNYIYVVRGKKYYNPNLLHYINEMLHELASFALKSGAIYINTDGYFFLKNSRYIEFARLLNSLKIEYRAISGRGHIVAFNDYCISGIALVGDETTKKTRWFDRRPEKYLDNIISQAKERNLRMKFNYPLYKVAKKTDCDIISWWSNL